MKYVIIGICLGFLVTYCADSQAADADMTPRQEAVFCTAALALAIENFEPVDEDSDEVARIAMNTWAQVAIAQYDGDGEAAKAAVLDYNSIIINLVNTGEFTFNDLGHEANACRSTLTLRMRAILKEAGIWQES